MFDNLLAEIARNKLTKLDLQRELELSQSTFYCKINGKNEFTLSEAKKIRKTFFPNLTLDYLFEESEIKKEVI